MEDASAGNNAAGADDGIHRHPHAAAFLREDELGRRLLGDLGADRPVQVVQVELGDDVDQVHIGLVVGVEGADVAPVADLLGIDVAEVVGDDAAHAPSSSRDDVPAEIVAGVGILGVFMEGVEEDIGLEDVDAHGGADHVRVEAGADGIAVLGLLLEAGDAEILVDLGDAEAAGFVGRHLDGGEGDVGIVPAVPVHHLVVVHLIDVVAGEDQGGGRGLRLRCSGNSGRRRRRCPGTSLRETRFMGGMISMYSPSSAERMFQPSRTCRIRSKDLYCVRIRIRRTSELMQLERVKSMIR